MDYHISDWNRLVSGNTPVYVSRSTANWFVPNAAGDRILRQLAAEAGQNGSAERLAFLSRLPENNASAYEGRRSSLDLENIRELWFHLTNRCNMRCAHCLFSSEPSATGALDAETVLRLAGEAWLTGCRLFALTGGEPLVHPDINAILRGLLDLEGSHVALLTNGLLAEKLIRDFSLELDRLHLQISIDGIGAEHDAIRGKGAFGRLTANLRSIRSAGVPCTLSMCVTRDNMTEMERVVDYASANEVSNVHFMWYFIRGRGERERFAQPDELFECLRRAAEKAARLGVHIDNLESLRTQVFAPPGTIHDGSNAGWESLAVGDDGKLYPTPALVGNEELATPIERGLVAAWKESPVLERIRNASIVDTRSAMRYILGGGDLDHSYSHDRSFSGSDPYLPLHEAIALWLIARSAPPDARQNLKPALRLRMGEILESCGARGKVALTHSNCLLAAATKESLASIREFYSSAAGDRKEEILNPVGYDPALIDHIPEAFRFRGYGCGSPVMDAAIGEGEHVVDLGCGSGVECFIAARLTGRNGSVTGIDMLDQMLSLAEKARPGVRASLGYGNVTFRKGLLEALPIGDGSADVVISNCVMNLSLDKRKAYGEILRVLKPGGRMVISDVVCETEPDASIRNDESLRGECIAGALTETHLLSLLEETGFENIQLVKRFPYRTVNGHRFFSLTTRACKPKASEIVTGMYRGPLPWMLTDSGTLLFRGKAATLGRREAEELGDMLFLLDNQGYVINIEAENCCSCAVAPEEKPAQTEAPPRQKNANHASGCMVCGAPLVCEERESKRSCNYCGRTYTTQTICQDGHYVCDDCHADDAVEVIRHLCLTTRETDMLKLFERIRSHPAVKVHGPEYHAMVPGIILSTWRNLGGDLIDMNIESGINRGKTITGGSCGFMGICGAAAGAGIAFSIMLRANPLKPRERKSAQQVTATILSRIARLEAVRCCQRDCWIALAESAKLSKGLFDIPLRATHVIECSQKKLNKECIGKECPVF
ncbi:methyltransferase type 11 [Prosthecochloris sp. GSB1]|uniref:DUF5714 domain-containing protein n=1 Tax=Prosthecochloris sp. GSB1 TaxID=281093 RepID=UPI000B8D021D|nr:DUF5714 domain-containing protein [Prosthecochloris sp. GSB1]ASQ89711.1 methyltransferase type 11 [Prosthecochloris sp. GSB1]